MSAVPCSVKEVPSGGSGESVPACQVLDPLAVSSWDEFAQSWPECTFFHGQAWARVLHRTYGHRPCYALLGAASPDSPAGVGVLVPLMEVRSFLTGCRGVGLPFTDECPPLGGAALAGGGAALLAMARSRGWRSIEFRGGSPPVPDAQPSLSFFGHRLRFSGRDPEAVFAGCEASVRRATRKAQQSGVQVELSHSLEAVRDFYALHVQTRRKHGVPPQPFSFFRNIHKEIMANGQGFVAIARLESQAVAASVFFHLGRRAIYKFGASDERQQHLRANNLVMWEAISWFARQGFESLHFGRTSLGNAGLRRFKLGWGAEEETVSYYRFDLRSQGWLTATDRASGWHNRFFRLLPILPNRILGALLYPHLD